MCLLQRFLLHNEKIKRSKQVLALFLVCGFLFSNTSFASIGKVIYEYGDNYALDFDGNRRGLKKGAVIEEGDTLVTGAGRMQVRLVDGGLISVYPNSEYKIEKFKFAAASSVSLSEAQSSTENNVDADPRNSDSRNSDLIKLKESKSDRGFFNLLKGAARQVTGVLGRKYNDNFKFKTTIATVGIRGTGFLARICQADCFDKQGNPLQDGMYVKNNVGVITMTTNVGQIALAQGQAAFASSSEDAPTQTDESPAVSGDGSGDEIETFDFDGSVFQGAPFLEPTIVLKNMDFTFSDDASAGEVTVGIIDVAEAGDHVSQIGDEIVRFESNSAVPGIVFDKGDAMLVESGVDANLGVLWNRWNGNYSLTKDGAAVSSLDPNIHLIGAEQLTQNIMSLAPKGDVEYVGTSATSPTLTVGGNTLVGTQTFHAGLNFSGLAGGRGIELNHLNIETDFGDIEVDMHLENRLDLTSAKGVGEMHGYCSGCAGVGQQRTEMNGFSTVNIVGDNAQGIFGSYNLTGEGAAISGSYVGSEVVTR